MGKKDRKEKLSLKRRKRLLKNLKKSIVPSISKIMIRIHHVRLSGHYYLWSDLKDKIGKLKVDDEYCSDKRMPNYAKQAFGKFRKRKLTVFLNPIKGYLPQCIIEMSYPYEILLSKLWSKLPLLRVSFAEYTIDLFFKSPKDVKKYFKLLYRYIYFPYQKELLLHLDKKLSDKTRDINAWASTEKMKFYERGPDNKQRRERHWSVDDIDRIRIEFRAEWEDLDRKGLVSLELFSKNPKFELMLKNKFAFKRFKKTANNNLPGEYENYSAKDRKGHSGAFQNQYLYFKGLKSTSNISRATENVPGLKPLYDQIISKIKRRDKKWQKKYRKLHRSKIAESGKIREESGWKILSIEEAKYEAKETLKKLKKGSSI